MINRKTVFILGAGAHVPYGLLDGSGLLEAILESLPRSSSNVTTPFAEFIFNLNSDTRTRRQLQEFRQALDLGGHTSIDSFLATHAAREGFTDIGKLAVAYHLLPLEFTYSWSRGAQKYDWMSFFFASMLTGCLSSVDSLLASNNVDFVTFNYDRTLEDFLCTRVAHTYNLKPAAAWEKVQKFKLVHVYGSLGEFDPRVITATGRPVNARDPMSHASVRNAAESIRLMYEDRSEHSGIAEAMDLIRGAPYVCFLGFGFDPDNIKRLKLNECCAGKSGIFATRYRTADGDWGRVLQSMYPVAMNPSTAKFDTNSINWDSLEFLHQTQALG